MVYYEALTPANQVKYRDCDRFLAFDSVQEVDIVAKAAAARTKYRLDHFDDPFPADKNLAAIPVDAMSVGIPSNPQHINDLWELLDFFAHEGYTCSRHWHPVRQETDRQRARDLADKLVTAAHMYDDVQAITSPETFPGE